MRIAIKLSDSYKGQKRGWHASCRIRGHWLAKYWDELDDIFYPEYFNQTNGEFFKLDNQLEKLKDYDAVILHKTYEFELARKLRERGQKVIVDLSDPDYLLGFSDVHRAGLCLMTLNNSDACVVNNKLMTEDLQEGYGKPIFYIPDRVNPKIIESNNIKNLVWFGHSDNRDSYISSALPLGRLGYKLTIISDKPAEGFLGKETRFIPYNPDTINDEIKKCDAVFLGDKLNEYKSPNRWQLARALNMPIVTIDDLDMDIRESVKEWKNLLTKI